ncbi:MAG TPA: lysylphosphatidylglycerol synthase transmembrane domain-containing protein [Pyrinomonadaceae bacterium]|nr:lysylphosphatidylglycerol synthase transmembrane domain-containing protein [Pyrinomonadaceae bacterium]
MSQQTKARSATKRFAPAGAVFAVLGCALFVYFVRKAGVGEVWEYMRRLGWGFLIILALSGFRFVVRSSAWMLCFEAPYGLRFRDAFRAYLIGDAAGNIVPLGIVVSEPAKAALVRDRVPLVAGLSAIAIENIFYSLSVALFVFSGAVALLLSFPLSKTLRWTSLGILGGVAVIVPVVFLVLRMQWRILSGMLAALSARGIGRRVLAGRGERVRALEDRVYGFYERNRARFLPILLLEASFHLAGVAEAYVTLYFIFGSPPSILNAFVLESVNRVINVVFKFVPMRVGIDEAGTGMLAKALQLGTATGVTLAIVRKARMLFWTAVGVALLVARGLSLNAVTGEIEETQQEEVLKDSSPQPLENIR